ncbi:hypothetical protein [Ramlibacter sp.]|uniref:hypothetical protein n=1 Tax=Ramlibacter sp. TaxID=1917967 RepID=UPI003D0EA9F0
MAGVPPMAVPLAHASDLRTLIDFYRHTLGFELVQCVPAWWRSWGWARREFSYGNAKA